VLKHTVQDAPNAEGGLNHCGGEAPAGHACTVGAAVASGDSWVPVHCALCCI
jgi:hypothetical protein